MSGDVERVTKAVIAELERQREAVEKPHVYAAWCARDVALYGQFDIEAVARAAIAAMERPACDPVFVMREPVSAMILSIADYTVAAR